MAEPQSTWADAVTIRPVDTSDVVVVGAGPTGLMMAAELALGGAKVQLLEERIDKPNITRAFAVHARTLELYQILGDTPHQTEALEHAIMVDPKTPDVAWEAANHYLVQGENEKALREFGIVIANDTSLQASALQFCWRIRPDVDALLRDVVPARADAYISFVEQLETRQETTGAEKSKLFPTDLGLVVTDFLKQYFDDIMDYNFTARIEEEFIAEKEGRALHLSLEVSREEYEGLSPTKKGRSHLATKVNSASKLIKIEEVGASLPEAQRIPATGTYTLSAPPVSADAVQASDFEGDVAERTGMGSFAAVDQITMVCIPDLMTLYNNGDDSPPVRHCPPPPNPQNRMILACGEYQPYTVETRHQQRIMET